LGRIEREEDGEASASTRLAVAGACSIDIAALTLRSGNDFAGSLRRASLRTRSLVRAARLPVGPTME
jgi:hypothetical protein